MLILPSSLLYDCFYWMKGLVSRHADSAKASILFTLLLSHELLQNLSVLSVMRSSGKERDNDEI